jgi:hypothetical protein
MKMKSSLRFKVLAGLFAAVLALAGFGGAAFADSSDPYLNAYMKDDNTGEYIAWGTFPTNAGEQLQGFYISPAVTEAFDALPSYFDTKEDAENISLELIFDTPPSISDAEIFEVEPEQVGDKWITWVGLILSDEESFGSFSVKATNTSVTPNSFTNVTIVRNEENPWSYTSVAGVGSWVYDPESLSVYSAAQMTVLNTDFYELHPNRSFPTASDSTMRAWGSSAVVSFDYYPSADEGHESYIWTFSLDGTPYPASGNEGWEYRVYRAPTPNAPSFDVVPLSEYVGTDSMMLRSGDIILWKYINFNSSDLFPEEIVP